MALNQNQFTETPIQGQLDLIGLGSNVVSAEVSPNQATALVPAQAVTVDNTAYGVPQLLGVTVATQAPAGFVGYNLKDINYPTNARVELCLAGTIMFMTAGGAINRWANVEYVPSSVEVINSAGVNPVCGFAYDQSSGSGSLIRVYIVNAQESGSSSISDISGLQAALNAITAVTYPYEAETAITTVGAGTITAAAIIGKLIKRTGLTANTTDTLDTAVNIVAALQAANSAVVNGSSFEFKIKNPTLYNLTLQTATGITLTGNVVLPPNTVATFLATITSGTAVAIEHVAHANLTNPPLLITTALTTSGATGTITAAGIVGGITLRTGSGQAFTDTTDTALNIVAALPNAFIGDSFVYIYNNNTGYNATLAAGSGVTFSGDDSVEVPTGTWAKFLVTLTSLTAVSIVGIATGSIGTLPSAQFSTGTTATTFTAGELTGAAFVVYTNTQGTPGSIATRTATQMLADIGNSFVGQSWLVRIVNGQGTGTLTVTAGTGVTLTGTATVAANTTRDFIATVTNVGSPAITLQNVGTGTFS